jgi:hypothetical protein
MHEVHTNQPTGQRYEKAMAKWLIAHSFHLIDKGDRNRLLECLDHQHEIEKWRASLTEADRFRFNHPNTVLRKWKAATVIPDPNAPPKVSAYAKLQTEHVKALEKNHRLEREIERGGGDLWTPQDTADDIATVVLGKLSANKAERVARAILKKLKDSSNACARSRAPAEQTGQERFA